MKIVKSKLKNYISTENFQFIFGIMFLISLYIVIYTGRELSYVNCVLNAFNNSIFLLIFFSLFLINTINSIKKFDSNNEFIIRCQSKSKYLKELTKNIFVNNLIIFLLEITIFIFLLIIFNRNGIIIDEIGGYSVTNVTYTIFYLTRLFILMQCLSLILAFIYKSSFKIIMWIFVFAFVIAIMNTSYIDGYIIEGFNFSLLNPVEYLHVQQYKDFGFELEVSFFYVLAWIVITYIVYLITSKRIKQIGD